VREGTVSCHCFNKKEEERRRRRRRRRRRNMIELTFPSA